MPGEGRAQSLGLVDGEERLGPGFGIERQSALCHPLSCEQPGHRGGVGERVVHGEDDDPVRHHLRSSSRQRSHRAAAGGILSPPQDLGRRRPPWTHHDDASGAGGRGERDVQQPATADVQLRFVPAPQPGSFTTRQDDRVEPHGPQTKAGPFVTEA